MKKKERGEMRVRKEEKEGKKKLILDLSSILLINCERIKIIARVLLLLTRNKGTDNLTILELNETWDCREAKKNLINCHTFVFFYLISTSKYTY